MYVAQQPGRAPSSAESIGSSVTVKRHTIRSLSTSSLASTASLLSVRARTTISERRASLSALFSRPSQFDLLNSLDQPAVRLNDVDEDGTEYDALGDDAATESTTIFYDPQESNATAGPDADEASFMDPIDLPERRAFRRWISTLGRKKLHKPIPVTPRSERWSLDDFDTRPTPPVIPKHSRHQKSDSSASSMAFVTAVKSATATIATASIATLSHRNSQWRHGRHRSSIVSETDRRQSGDTQRSAMDRASVQRSRKRRDKLDELIQTEEGYLADLKALSSALFTLLGRLTNLQDYVRHCASTTLSQMIGVHHSLLTQLRLAVPVVDCAPVVRRGKGHARWYSIDGALPTRKDFGGLRRERRSLDTSRSSSGNGEPHLLYDPSIVFAVATILDDHIAAFSVYNDFGEHYELVRFAIDQAQQSSACWQEYDTAIETLAYALNPMHTRDANRRKALTVKDLLIKPIQRLPRYVLLLGDLHKLTPICDGPNAHEALSPVIRKLEAVCENVNQNRRSLDQKRLLESTWLISERLSFHNQLPRTAFLKLLGPVALCGCLHVAYCSRDAIKGRYVICVLFETTLLLAHADEDDCKYSVLAGVALGNATITEADNGRGLQCHTAPHSWKVVYEHHSKMYEIMLTACSATEATAWRGQIVTCAAAQAKASGDRTRGTFELYSPMVEDMKTVGKAVSNAGSFIRRMSRESIRRAATFASTSNLSQVIIKNTQDCKEALDNSSRTTLQMRRSQSVATPSHVQTLAPSRADRVRLEALLSDVWTKDVLPCPGMTPRRSDPIRASANHVMRKFSMASISSNFSTAKRNLSSTSITSSRKEDMPPPRSWRPGDKERVKHSRPPLVDFHNAPEAFLPEDFDLGGSARRERSALRTFTMNMERPFSPLLGENRSAALRRTQSVREAPIYRVVQQRAATPAPAKAVEQVGSAVDGPTKTPWKSKSRSRLLRVFG
ncbi:hypothetical protein LTR53_006000 [Teratosphaeriaceae sp. CCFEE 6253]|nr:hypothetical protein LTR53_006000 [Teratosphaeriaceae sp. CCFEE 6253]